MDTAAYLTRQGWRGPGHSLNPSGHGVTKPLLVAKKTNALGLGKRKNDIHADQWWARAFDATLEHLNVSKDEVTGMTATVTCGLGLESMGDNVQACANNLYGYFVRGEGLHGTQIPQVVKELKMDSTQDVKSRGNEEATSDLEKRRQKKGGIEQPTEDPLLYLGQTIMPIDCENKVPENKALELTLSKRRKDKRTPHARRERAFADKKGTSAMVRGGFYSREKVTKRDNSEKESARLWKAKNRRLRTDSS